MELANNTRRVFYINVEEINEADVKWYIRNVQRIISGKKIFKVKEWKKLNKKLRN